MKLYHASASPFVRKVLVLLHEIGKADTVALETVATTAMQSDEGLMAANPLAKLPALVCANGTTLYDSRVITTYLDDLYHGDMYPDTDVRWQVLTLEATGDGIMDSAISMVYEVRLRPEDKQSSDWIEAQWAKISRTINVLNASWMDRLSGPVNMGHISVACALAYLDFRLGSRNWRQGNDALAAWFEAFESRPSMTATRPPKG